MIVTAAFAALSCGAFFWLDSRSSSAIDLLRDRMPSAVVSLEGSPATELSSDSSARKAPLAAAPAPSPSPAAIDSAQKQAPTPAPSSALPTAPIDGLFEMAGESVLPIIRPSDGLTPFAAYRAPAVPVSGPRIAVAVIDFGLSAEGSDSLVRTLPAAVSLVFSPYGENLDSLQERARAAGHELWMGLPLESSAVPSPDPGAQAIYVNAGIERNAERLLWTLGRAFGYAGVAAVTPSPLMNSTAQTARLLAPVFSRGLGFADLSPSPGRMALLEAAKVNAPYIGGAVLIDSPANAQAIRAKLEQAQEQAVKDGSVVILIRPYPVTLDALREWSAELNQKKSATLVPLSSLTDKP